MASQSSAVDWITFYKFEGIITEQEDGEFLYYGKTDAEIIADAEIKLSPEGRENIKKNAETFEAYVSVLARSCRILNADGTINYLELYKSTGVITEGADGCFLYYGYGTIEILTACEYWLSRHTRDFHANNTADWHCYLVSLAQQMFTDHEGAVRSMKENNPFAWGIKLAAGENPFPQTDPKDVASILRDRVERSPMLPSLPAEEESSAKTKAKPGGRPSLLQEQAFWAIEQHDYRRKEWKEVAEMREKNWPDEPARKPEAWRILARRHRIKFTGLSKLQPKETIQ